MTVNEKKKKRVVQSSGKRKQSIARATIKNGDGSVKVNLTPLEVYGAQYARMRIDEALKISEDFVNLGELSISVNVQGGGVMGQADAVASSISKGLCEWSGSDELLAAYHAYDRTLIAGDDRQTETHKPGQSSKGPRHRRQKSYR